MFEVIKADQANFDARSQMAQIFAEGFTQWLVFFSKDSGQIAKAFAHMFQLDQFYIALSGDRVAAMAFCTTGTDLPVRLDAIPLRQHLGWFKGTLASLLLKKEFEAKPDPANHDKGSIGFVGTALDFRGQGAALYLLTHILTYTSFDEYVIEEVADNNLPAMRLYEKLGFREYKRKAMPKAAAARNGIHALISLKYVKPSS